MRFLNIAILGALGAMLGLGQTTTITTFAGNAALGAGFGGDGAVATAAQLNAPSGVASDAAGNIYIADLSNYRIREVSGGMINTIAGTGTAGSGGDSGSAAVATLAGPAGIAVDGAGNIYIADGPGNRVRRISGGIITTFAGGNGGGFAGDTGAATSAQLNYPSAVAIDSAGDVYIADTGNNRIRKVTNGIITTVAGSAGLGYNGDNQSPTIATLWSPQGIAVDSLGNLYIADTNNQRIREVSNGIITTVAGNGTAGFLGDGGSPAAAEINSPHGLLIDSSNNLYIADTGNNMIRKVTGATITRVAGTGQPGYAGDGGLPTNAQLNLPWALAIDPNGYLYVADSQNNVIRQLTIPFITGVIPQFAAGGSYVTDFYVINKSSTPQSFSISFYDNNGNPVSVPFGTNAQTTLTGTIPASGTGFYEAGTLSGTLVSGSGVITSISSVVVQTVFRHQGSSGAIFEAGVASSAGSFEVLVPYDANTDPLTGNQIYTGFAVANMDGINSAVLTCTARNSAGTIIPSAVTIATLPARGHFAGYNFPALAGTRGTVDCTSTARIAVMALRALGTDAISSFPVILK